MNYEERAPKVLSTRTKLTRATYKLFILESNTLIDANDVIVHLFRPEVREFYGLERMWADDAAEEIITVGTDG